jgi:hypothetical protein
MADNSQQIRDLIIESANVQIATVNAGIEFWKAWINSASELSAKLSSEVSNAADASKDTDKIIGSITDHSRTFVREIGSLPTVFSKSFETELAKKSSAREKKPPLARMAKAKK